MIMLIVLLSILLQLRANAFTFIITNDHPKKLIYEFVWMDCVLEGVRGSSCVLAGGEIVAGLKKEFDHDYNKGTYKIKWYKSSAWVDTEYEETTYLLKVPQKGILHSTPLTIPRFFHGFDKKSNIE